MREIIIFTRAFLHFISYRLTTFHPSFVPTKVYRLYFYLLLTSLGFSLSLFSRFVYFVRFSFVLPVCFLVFFRFCFFFSRIGFFKLLFLVAFFSLSRSLSVHTIFFSLLFLWISVRGSFSFFFVFLGFYFSFLWHLPHSLSRSLLIHLSPSVLESALERTTLSTSQHVGELRSLGFCSSQAFFVHDPYMCIYTTVHIAIYSSLWGSHSRAPRAVSLPHGWKVV